MELDGLHSSTARVFGVVAAARVAGVILIPVPMLVRTHRGKPPVVSIIPIWEGQRSAGRTTSHPGDAIMRMRAAAEYGAPILAFLLSQPIVGASHVVVAWTSSLHRCSFASTGQACKRNPAKYP